MHHLPALKKRIEEIKDWLRRELATLRTGRATPALLDSIRVESYGALSPISHLAALSVENARTLRISPWDKTQIGSIQEAIAKANLGLSVAVDKDGLRVSFPELTSERRAALLRSAGEKLEQARVSLRNERGRLLEELEQKQKNKEISEDDRFRFKNEIQKIVDGAARELEEMGEKKRKELSE